MNWFFLFYQITYQFLCDLYHHRGFDISKFIDIFTCWLNGFAMGSRIPWFVGFWFVATLLLIRIIMESNFMRKHKFLITFLCFLYCCFEPFFTVNPYITHLHVYRIFSCLPFFVVGMGIKEHEINIQAGSFELKLVGVLLFFILTFIQGRPDLAYQCYGLNYSVFFANALLGSWLLYNVCSSLPSRNWIRTLSTGTLLILGLHGILHANVHTLLRLILGVENFYLPMLVSLVVIIILYPLIKYCESNLPQLLGNAKK